jgi:DNA-binding transcriptional MerR regulator
MPLPVIADNLDAVPENARGAYTQREDGKFVLDADKESIESTFTPGLKSALQNERKTATERGKALETWNKLGISPEDAQKLLEEKQERERKDAEAKGQWDTLKDQLNQRHAQEKETLASEINALSGTINTLLIDNEAVRACQDLKGESTLLLPAIRSQTRVIKQGNEYITQVLDKNGNPRIGGADGSLMTVRQLVEELKADPVYGRAFDGSGASGSGAAPGAKGTGGAGAKVSKRSELKSDDDKLAFIKAHGYAAFRDLAD